MFTTLIITLSRLLSCRKYPRRKKKKEEEGEKIKGKKEASGRIFHEHTIARGFLRRKHEIGCKTWRAFTKKQNCTALWFSRGVVARWIDLFRVPVSPRACRLNIFQPSFFNSLVIVNSVGLNMHVVTRAHQPPA